MKPGFFRDVDLVELSPLHRLLFAGLWCWADREGRLKDSPKQIRFDILPNDPCDCDQLLADLAEKNFILRYEVDGNKYIEVINFKVHQNPHKNEIPSEIPGPLGKSREITGALPSPREITGALGLIPSSLIPSSLIPDSLNPASAADAGASDSLVSPAAPVEPPETPDEDEDDEPIDFKTFGYRWNAAKGVSKLPKGKQREPLAAIWEANPPIASWELEIALAVFLEDEYAKEHDYPIRLFLKNPLARVSGDARRIHAEEKALALLRLDSDAPESVSVKSTVVEIRPAVDYLAKWNLLVPTSVTEFDGGRKYADALAVAKIDTDFTERFDEICELANGILKNKPEATWLNFYWLLSRKDGTLRMNYKRLLTEMRGMAAATCPKSGQDDEPWHEGRKVRRGEHYEADMAKYLAYEKARGAAESG